MILNNAGVKYNAIPRNAALNSSLGIVGNVLAGVAILGVVGGLHYLVWGRALSAEVAAEREALRRQDLAELEPRKAPEGAIQDLSRVQGIQKK